MGDEASKMAAQIDDTTSTDSTKSGVTSVGGISSTSVPVPPRDGSSSNTLIIFDWDDTLLCSSAIRLSQPGSELLRQLERAVEAILLTAMSLGETIIVTNGTESWVHDSATRFVPGLLPILKNIKNISARAKYEHAFPEDPFAWKRECFQELLGTLPAAESIPELPSMYAPGADSTEGVNLVVIGDSWYEIQAARSTLGRPGAPSLVKTVKFKEVPTVQELLGQLRRAGQELARVCAGNSSASWGLASKPLPTHLECLVACASAWEIIAEQAGAGAFAPRRPPCYVGAAAAATHTPGLANPGNVALGANKPNGFPPGLPPPPLPQHGAGGTYHLSQVEGQPACGWVF